MPKKGFHRWTPNVKGLPWKTEKNSSTSFWQCVGRTCFSVKAEQGVADVINLTLEHAKQAVHDAASQATMASSSSSSAEDLPYFIPAQLRELQTRPNSHLPAREAPKDQNRHVQIRALKPSSVSSEQEQTCTDSQPLVEDTPAEYVLAAGGANSGRFGARCPTYQLQQVEAEAPQMMHREQKDTSEMHRIQGKGWVSSQAAQHINFGHSHPVLVAHSTAICDSIAAVPPYSAL